VATAEPFNAILRRKAARHKAWAWDSRKGIILLESNPERKLYNSMQLCVKDVEQKRQCHAWTIVLDNQSSQHYRRITTCARISKNCVYDEQKEAAIHL